MSTRPRSLSLSLAATLGLGLVSTAHAQDAAPPAAPPAAPKLSVKFPELKLSALTFFSYRYVLAGEDPVKKLNEFSIDRAYVNIEPVIDETWAARITPDLNKPDAAGKNYVLRLKFAYIDGKKIGGTGVSVRAGMLGTPFTDALDKAWGFRVLVKSPLDAFGVATTADLGGSVGYSWGSGEARLFITNGEGYEYIETSLGKDVTLHITQELTTGLNLSLGALYGGWIGGASKFWNPTGPGTLAHYDNRIVAPLLLTWDQGGLKAGVEAAFIRRTPEGGDALTGLSATAYVVAKIGDKMEIPVRFMRFDPNTDSKTGKDDEIIHAVAGYSYNFAGQLKVVPNLQAEKKGKDKPTISGFVHLEGKL